MCMLVGESMKLSNGNICQHSKEGRVDLLPLYRMIRTVFVVATCWYYFKSSLLTSFRRKSIILGIV